MSDDNITRINALMIADRTLHEWFTARNIDNAAASKVKLEANANGMLEALSMLPASEMAALQSILASCGIAAHKENENTLRISSGQTLDASIYMKLIELLEKDSATTLGFESVAEYRGDMAARKINNMLADLPHDQIPEALLGMITGLDGISETTKLAIKRLIESGSKYPNGAHR